MLQAKAGEDESRRELKLSYGGCCEACLPVQLYTSLGHGGAMELVIVWAPALMAKRCGHKALPGPPG